MRWIDYREKLNVGFSDVEKAKLLSNKIMTFIEFSVANANYSDSDYYRFCLMTGVKYTQPYSSSSELAKIFKTYSNSAPNLISYYVAFVNTQTSITATQRKKLVGVLEAFLDDLNMPYEILRDKDGWFIFPKGAEELDNALVSEPLAWLKTYSKTRAAFIKALKSYSEATATTASDTANMFRKSLETFFQEFFNSSKTLENLKTEYGTYMKSKGVPAEISNNLETLLQAYANFMNGYAKHHDKTSINVLEYIMYQTGNIIRLLITLKQEKQ